MTLFEEIGFAFPWLKEIHIKVFELPLPVEALTTLLSISRHTLETLVDMEDVILRGNRAQFDALTNAFRGHRALRKLNLDWCQSLNGGTLDNLVCSLSTISTLNKVQICGSVLSGHSLELLCNIHTLDKLCVVDDDIKDNEVTTLAEALEANYNIRELNFRLCGLDTSTGARFANVLRVNKAINVLELRIKDIDFNKYGSYLTDALRENTTLWVLRLFIDGASADVPLIRRLLLDALENHPSLKSLRIAFRGTYNKDIVQESFVGPLEQLLKYKNFTLEELKLDGVELSEEIKLLLKLNEAGRAKLLENSEAFNLWVKALFSNKDDIDVSFLILSLNPSLCVEGARPTVTKTRGMTPSEGLLDMLEFI